MRVGAIIVHLPPPTLPAISSPALSRTLILCRRDGRQTEDVTEAGTDLSCAQVRDPGCEGCEGWVEEEFGVRLQGPSRVSGYGARQGIGRVGRRGRLPREAGCRDMVVVAVVVRWCFLERGRVVNGIC